MSPHVSLQMRWFKIVFATSFELAFINTPTFIHLPFLEFQHSILVLYDRVWKIVINGIYHLVWSDEGHGWDTGRSQNKMRYLSVVITGCQEKSSAIGAHRANIGTGCCPQRHDRDHSSCWRSIDYITITQGRTIQHQFGSNGHWRFYRDRLSIKKSNTLKNFSLI